MSSVTTGPTSRTMSHIRTIWAPRGRRSRARSRRWTRQHYAAPEWQCPAQHAPRQQLKVERAVAISDDDGETFGPIAFDAADLASVPGLHRELRWRDLLFQPGVLDGPQPLTIRKSVDSTASWAPTTMLVQAGNSAGYSCLVKGELQGGAEQPGGPSRGHGRGGILYEDTAGSISFATFPTDFSSRAGGGWDP